MASDDESTVRRARRNQRQRANFENVMQLANNAVNNAVQGSPSRLEAQAAAQRARPRVRRYLTDEARRNDERQLAITMRRIANMPNTQALSASVGPPALATISTSPGPDESLLIVPPAPGSDGPSDAASAGNGQFFMPQTPTESSRESVYSPPPGTMTPQSESYVSSLTSGMRPSSLANQQVPSLVGPQVPYLVGPPAVSPPVSVGNITRQSRQDSSEPGRVSLFGMVPRTMTPLSQSVASTDRTPSAPSTVPDLLPYMADDVVSQTSTLDVFPISNVVRDEFGRIVIPVQRQRPEEPIENVNRANIQEIPGLPGVDSSISNSADGQSELTDIDDIPLPPQPTNIPNEIRNTQPSRQRLQQVFNILQQGVDQQRLRQIHADSLLQQNLQLQEEQRAAEENRRAAMQQQAEEQNRNDEEQRRAVTQQQRRAEQVRADQDRRRELAELNQQIRDEQDFADHLESQALEPIQEEPEENVESEGSDDIDGQQNIAAGNGGDGGGDDSDDSDDDDDDDDDTDSMPSLIDLPEPPDSPQARPSPVPIPQPELPERAEQSSQTEQGVKPESTERAEQAAQTEQEVQPESTQRRGILRGFMGNLFQRRQQPGEPPQPERRVFADQGTNTNPIFENRGTNTIQQPQSDRGTNPRPGPAQVNRGTNPDPDAGRGRNQQPRPSGPGPSGPGPSKPGLSGPGPSGPGPSGQGRGGASINNNFTPSVRQNVINTGEDPIGKIFDGLGQIIAKEPKAAKTRRVKKMVSDLIK